MDDLVDIVSKNGSLLLNIGPRSDGTIPDPEVAMLKAIGGWLRVNGEAIYGTRPWTRFGEGPTQIVEGSFADTKRKPFTSQDVRFTTRRAVLYATVLDWPSDSRILIKSLAKGAANAPTITTVELLGATAAGDLVAARGRPARATAGDPSQRITRFRCESATSEWALVRPAGVS